MIIHGAKLINKNKYTRLSVLKNKKNQKKKLYIKIEKRQRSIRRTKRGCGLVFAPIRKRLVIHAQNGRIVFIFFVLRVAKRAYNCETAVLTLFGALCSLLFVLTVICQRAKKYAPKSWLLHAPRRLAFIYPLARFCFSFLSITFHSFLLTFSPSFLLTFSPSYLLTYLLISEIINNIYINYIICVRVHARARNAAETRHKKRAAKIAAPVVTLKNNQI